MEDIKKTIGLTAHQKQLVNNFLEAAKKMGDAGIYSFINQETGNAYFVNRLNVGEFWIGEDEYEAPFDNDFESIELEHINDSNGCISIFFSDVFDNYALMNDMLCFETK